MDIMQGLSSWPKAKHEAGGDSWMVVSPFFPGGIAIVTDRKKLKKKSLNCFLPPCINA
jgi:hypothetical protein